MRVLVPFTAVALVGSLALIATPAGASSSTSVVARGNRLYVGQVLHVGDRLVSPSGSYAAVVETGGKLQILHKGTAVWTSTRRSGLSRIVSLKGTAGLAIRATKKSRRTYLALQNSGNLTLYSGSGVPTWQVGPHAGVSTLSQAPYTYNEFYGGSNPSVACFTCAASDVTGAAPPTNTLDAGTGVDNLTGDFSTANTLFSSPAIGGTLGITLTYDAQLAQSGATGLFGAGWSSPFTASISNESSAVINQSDGSEVTFQDAAGGETPDTTCPLSADGVNDVNYQTTAKYTVPGSPEQWCASSTTQGQLGEWSGVGYTYEVQGGTSIEDFAWDGQLDETTTLAASSGTTGAGLFNLYNVQDDFAPSTTNTGVNLTQQCPNYDTCDITYASDGRDLVEVLNSTGQVSEVI